MLPSTKRLSRASFTAFLASSTNKTVFNTLGTLKYRKSLTPRVSIVISSKHEKRAVYRNRLRRRLYTLFGESLAVEPIEAILYTSKQAPKMSLDELKQSFYGLNKKIS
jgi:ribonuclease P protein component